MDISTNIFTKNTLDERIGSFSVSSKEILNSSFTLLDAVEKLQLIKSRSETKRLIKSNAIKINDENYNQSDFSLSSYMSENETRNLTKTRIKEALDYVEKVRLYYQTLSVKERKNSKPF